MEYGNNVSGKGKPMSSQAEQIATSSPVQEHAQTRPRLFFVDHLRVALTMLVITHHLAITYGAFGGVPGLWYYIEPTKDSVASGLLSLFVLLNQGFEYDELTGAPHRDFDDRWARWEKTGGHAVSPTPGAKEALDAIRRMGVTVIFNSNRNAFNAAPTEQAIDDAGIGPAVHGKTLYLAGDDATGSMKDGRRHTIANQYCVIAMGGDQLGDFSDLFNARPLSVPARREAASAGAFARLWGDGWLMLSNPVYGPSIRGGFDDVFPSDKRWSDPQGGK